MSSIPKPHKLDDGLFKVLRRGDRLKELVFDLPPKSQLRLVRKAGHATLKGKSAASIEVGLPRLFKTLRQNRLAVEDTLTLWLIERGAPEAQSLILPKPVEWRELLVFRIAALQTDSPLPEPISTAIDSVIEGDSEDLGHRLEDAARRWGAGTLVLKATKRIDATLAAAATELDRAREIFAAVRTGDTLSAEGWGEVGMALGRLGSRWAEDRAHLAAALASLGLAAEVLDFPFKTEPPEVDADGADVSVALAAGSTEQRESIVAHARVLLDELRAIQHDPSNKALLDLAMRLPEDLPPRDLGTIRAEADSLVAAGDAADASEQAPILNSLARVLLRQEALSDDELSWLESELTARTLHLIRTGSLQLREVAADAGTEGGVAATRDSARDHSRLDVDEAEFDEVSEEGATPSDDSPEEEPDTPAPPEDDDPYQQHALGATDPGEGSGDEPGAGSSGPEPGSDSVQDGSQPQTEAASEDSEPQDPSAGSARVDASAPLEGGASSLAEYLLDDLSHRRGYIPSLLARLLAEVRLDDAFWLATALGEGSPLPVWLVELAQLGLQLRPGFQESERRLAELLGEAPGRLSGLEQGSLPLLAAACLRPALVAPAQTYPVVVLHQLAKDGPALPGLGGLLEGLAEFAEKGQPLSPALLSGLSTTAQLEGERSALRAETERWLEEAPFRKTKFQAASVVWKHWVGRGGELRQMVKDSQAGKVPAAQMRQLTEDWGDRDSFTDRLDRTDRDLSRRLKWKPIRFGAFEAIRRLVGEALDLVARWQRLDGATSEAGGGARQFELGVLRDLKATAEDLVSSLPDELDGHDELASACKVVLRGAATEMISDFAAVAGSAPPRDPAIARERIPSLIPEVDPDELFAESATPLLEGVIRHVARPYTLAEAAQEHLQRGRVSVAQSLADEASIDLSEKTRLAREWRRRAEQTIDRLWDDLEHRQLQGVLTAKQKAEFDGRVEALRRGLEADPERPDRMVHGCSELAAELTALAGKKAADLESRLCALERLAETRDVELPENSIESVRELLAGGFLEVASEHIAEIQQGIERGRVSPERLLEAPERVDHLRSFFSSVDELTDLCRDMRRVEEAISAGEVGSRYSTLDPEQRRAASVAVSAWRHLCEGRLLPGREKEHLEPLLEVLRWLGFQLQAGEASPATPRDGRRVHFRVAATIDAPVPRFGSGADGRHEVVLAWGAPEPEGVAQWLASNPRITSDQPVSLLCLWPLDGAARRRWIHALRSERLSVLLIDSCLVAWLCRFSASSRTRTLFAAGLPGGFDNPYMPEAAGGVAPEMFFGRDRHVEDLWRPEGPCIVFGGRQLGKSALLRQVVRRYHDPGDDRFVLYEGTPHEADLFDLLRGLLAREGLLPKRGLQGGGKIKGAIASMLQKNPRRRVLVLLDECDQFLDEDSRHGFRQVSELRNLMTETDRRFKVVFAGLHNVQRFQRISNQPLAHFGEPLCVGPLEPQAGRDLVRIPFESLGYRFEPETLSSRILAHTNSHPSLAQLFCHALMDELRNRPAQRRESTPPYVIDESLIASVYRNVSLGEKMRARFDWTLDLDLRYRLLGYTFAYLEHEGDFKTAEGVPAHVVLDWARTTWPEGFSAANEDELTGLLEEMKGLGILVGGPARGYRLRSPNVLRLLGGADDVHRELESFVGRPYEPRPEPQVIRRLLRLPGVPASPLSLDQEGRIMARERGLVLVLGSQALGLSDVWPALEDLVEHQSGEEWSSLEVAAGPSVAETLSGLQLAYREAASPGLLVHLAFDDANAIDRFEALERIAEWLERLTHEARFVRVVACLGAAAIFEGHRSGALGRLERHEAVSLLRLRRWKEEGLRQWFHDAEAAPDSPNLPVRWISETGGWPLLLVGLLADRRRPRNGQQTLAGESVPATKLLELAGLDAGSPGLRLYRVLAELGDEVDVLEDLPEFVSEARLDQDHAPLIGALLDLDLLIGSRERIRAEPVMAKAALEVASG